MHRPTVLSGEPEIRMLTRADSQNAALTARVTELTNEVYAVAEEGLWRPGATRTTIEEIVELTRAGELAVACLAGRAVGSVRVRRLDEHTGEFGMLAADPAHRGLGVGRELVRFAERRSRDAGLRDMQLELLVPRNWSHPSKVFLDQWYTRMGYRVAGTGAIEALHPALAPLLATPCDFMTYRKPL